MAIRISGNNHNINNEDPKVKMMIPRKNGTELPFCGRCCDFKPSWEMFETLQCGHNFCKFCMNEYVASCLRDNIVIVPCPDSKCNVEYGLEHFCSLLPLEVFKRWQKVIKDCNTLILDKQLNKNPIDVDDEEKSDVEEDAIVVIESNDDDVDNENIVGKKKKKNKKRNRNIY